jgi:hypothetical protein
MGHWVSNAQMKKKLAWSKFVFVMKYVTVSISVYGTSDRTPRFHVMQMVYRCHSPRIIALRRLFADCAPRNPWGVPLLSLKVKWSWPCALITTQWRCIGEWRYSSTHSLTSALDGVWSASRPGRFIPRERDPGTHWIGGWVGPRAVLEAVVKRKIPSPRREANRGTPIVQPVA